MLLWHLNRYSFFLRAYKGTGFDFALPFVSQRLLYAYRVILGSDKMVNRATTDRLVFSKKPMSIKLDKRTEARLAMFDRMGISKATIVRTAINEWLDANYKSRGRNALVTFKIKVR